MFDLLRQPGFFGTHATLGADLSQLMAALFTGLFIIGWIQARKHKADAHHWLMFSGMVSMGGFFVSYYMFRSLGVLAFEGKEGFGGSQALYDHVFVPVLILHIILVIVGLIMAVYLLVLGFRAQTFVEGVRQLKTGALQTSWGSMAKVWGAVGGVVGLYLVFLYATDRLSTRRSGVWIAFMLMPRSRETFHQFTQHRDSIGRNAIQPMPGIITPHQAVDDPIDSPHRHVDADRPAAWPAF